MGNKRMAQLVEPFWESAKLEGEIKKDLAGMCSALPENGVAQ